MAESDELDKIIESKHAVIESMQSDIENANFIKQTNE